MKPLQHPLLTDENIAPEVGSGLRARGLDVRSALDEGLLGMADVDVLRCAYAQQRVVVTHDPDFGRLAILAGEPFLGIVYVRPGHISSQYVLQALDVLRQSNTEVEPPFLIVVDRREDIVRVRVRRGEPW
jgi:predicted nuclease of predicted toxin-antitoxin system